MATSSRSVSDQNRPYQGYPYVNPVVIDVPTVDASTASKWTNLPRKPIVTTGVHKNCSKHSQNDNSSINIDMPNEAGSSRGTQPGTSRLQHSTEKKEDVPVVYIDLPDVIENNGDVISHNQHDRGQENPAFVQDTILFDPFENRQIDVNKPRESPETGNASGAGYSTPGSSAAFRPSPTVSEPNTNTRPNRPVPPSNLNLPSSLGSPSSSRNPSIPGFMNKESQVYGSSGSTEDGFTLTPLPVVDYPEPPPAYSEIAGTTNDRQTDQSTPPRTVVVVPETSPTVGLPSSNRKLVQCQNCRLRVHTVVVKENGPFTHFVALITVIFCILPVTIVVYCTDFFKYRVHFCPNCNHSVGYEIPILCQSMMYNGQ